MAQDPEYAQMIKRRQSAKWRRHSLKRYHGLTVATYDRLLAAPNGRCAVCATDKPMGQGRRFHVDHDHQTRKIRGLLCHHCNTGLGAFRDDPALLAKAIAYVAMNQTWKQATEPTG